MNPAPENETVPVDIVRLAAVMRQGDKAIKYLNRRTGAVLDGTDVDRAKRGLNADGVQQLLQNLLEVPKTDSRTIFGWMQDWARTVAPRIDARTADKILDKMSGAGGMGRFKAALIGNEPLLQSWDGYKHRMLCERVRLWLTQSQVSYRELDVKSQ